MKAHQLALMFSVIWLSLLIFRIQMHRYDFFMCLCECVCLSVCARAFIPFCLRICFSISLKTDVGRGWIGPGIGGSETGARVLGQISNPSCQGGNRLSLRAVRPRRFSCGPPPRNGPHAAGVFSIPAGRALLRWLLTWQCGGSSGLFGPINGLPFFT